MRSDRTRFPEAQRASAARQLGRGAGLRVGAAVLLLAAGGGCYFPGLDQYLHLDGGVGEDLAEGPVVDGGPPADLGGSRPDLGGTPGRDLGAPDLLGCPGLPCDVVCQNCGSSSKCSLDGNNQSACMASGNIRPGHRCATGNSDDCAAGSICLTVGQDGAGACFAFCRVAGDCAGAGACQIAVSGSGQRACTEAQDGCALLPQAGCDADTACYVVNGAGGTGCHAPGPGGQGAGCANDYDCGAGFACFQSPAGCQRICRAGNNSDCGGNATCTPVPGWPGAYGVCL